MASASSSAAMRIVTYNVNGLRARLSLSKSLHTFLDSLDADIICVQETKISRQELTADIAVAEGYESFFSCTRTVKKGRIGYSGVATFCRADVALPVAAEEGFTGLLNCSKGGESREKRYGASLVMEEFTKQELLELDNEGRCIVTDHGHFVLFNIYGPNAGCGDLKRQEFKLNFYKVLQCRLEGILKQGIRVIVVGDLNIAPFAIDSCDPGPSFEDNLSRKWLRSILICEGGPFSDVFRVFHPDRKEAYTCWSQASGAEEFNYGTRIDLMLVAGPCADNCNAQGCDGFVKCGVVNCDILQTFKRAKADTLPRWAGGRSLKLDGSDHAPVYMQLKDLPSHPGHEVPLLAARFMPELRGRQQRIVSIFQKAGERTSKEVLVTDTVDSALNCTIECSATRKNESAWGGGFETIVKGNGGSLGKVKKEGISNGNRKVQKLSQSSVRTFCLRKLDKGRTRNNLEETKPSIPPANNVVSEHLAHVNAVSQLLAASQEGGACLSTSAETSQEVVEKTITAAEEWERLKQLMQRNVPHCKGHGEPCVVRTVKKSGPNIGRGFYVCARAKGPASNPEARCDHFEWASSKTKTRKK